MNEEYFKLVESLADVNCTKCLHSKQAGDEYYCYYPRDPDQRHEVSDVDFCVEHGKWAKRNHNGRSRGWNYVEILTHFYNFFLDSTVTSPLQPQHPYIRDASLSEGEQC